MRIHAVNPRPDSMGYDSDENASRMRRMFTLRVPGVPVIVRIKTTLLIVADIDCHILCCALYAELGECFNETVSIQLDLRQIE